MNRKRKYKFVILGAGVSGLATAYRLSKEFPGEVLVLEKESLVGGLCKTICVNDSFYDLGSHRIHRNAQKEAFSLIEKISGDLLVKKTRRGRLKIKNSFIDYPITSAQMFLGIGIMESFLCAASLAKRKIFYQSSSWDQSEKNQNFERYLIKNAGLRAYHLFYEPYARKVWGCDPSKISTTAVKKRISMVKPMQFLKDIKNHCLKDGLKSYYHYLEGGIGSFATALETEILDRGAEIVKSINDFSFTMEKGEKTIHYLTQEGYISVDFEHLVSTIPIDELVLKLPLTENAYEHVQQLKWRGLKLVFLHIEGEARLPGETFYFPEKKYLLGRVSLPKCFSARMQPNKEFTTFSCELPCSENDALWEENNSAIYDVCLEDLKRAKLIRKEQNDLRDKNFVINLNKVYPLYYIGWKDHFSSLIKYLAKHFPAIYTSGKMGLFLHCNLDHSIEIGISLAKILTQGRQAGDWYEKLDSFHSVQIRD